MKIVSTIWNDSNESDTNRYKNSYEELKEEEL